jgi:hypothetical protein
MQKPLVINLFAGPGAGKSTTAAGVFCLLKLHGINAELITEFAKDLTWEKRERTLDNQLYVFAKQYHRMWRVKDQVEVMITDSPLLLSLAYGLSGKHEELVLDTFNQFSNMNFFIRRLKKYNPSGRNQTEGEAKTLDGVIAELLKYHRIFYTEVEGSLNAINFIMTAVLKELGFEQSLFKIREN